MADQKGTGVIESFVNLGLASEAIGHRASGTTRRWLLPRLLQNIAPSSPTNSDYRSIQRGTTCSTYRRSCESCSWGLHSGADGFVMVTFTFSTSNPSGSVSFAVDRKRTYDRPFNVRCRKGSSTGFSSPIFKSQRWVERSQSNRSTCHLSGAKLKSLNDTRNTAYSSPKSFAGSNIRSFSVIIDP